MAEEKHLFEYEYGGSTWVAEVYAEDADEARAKMRKMAHAKYLGVCAGTVPAFPGAGLWVRFICFWKNLWRARS